MLRACFCSRKKGKYKQQDTASSCILERSLQLPCESGWEEEKMGGKEDEEGYQSGSWAVTQAGGTGGLNSSGGSGDGEKWDGFGRHREDRICRTWR